MVRMTYSLTCVGMWNTNYRWFVEEGRNKVSTSSAPGDSDGVHLLIRARPARVMQISKPGENGREKEYGRGQPFLSLHDEMKAGMESTAYSQE